MQKIVDGSHIFHFDIGSVVEELAVLREAE